MHSMLIWCFFSISSFPPFIIFFCFLRGVFSGAFLFAGNGKIWRWVSSPCSHSRLSYSSWLVCSSKSSLRALWWVTAQSGTGATQQGNFLALCMDKHADLHTGTGTHAHTLADTHTHIQWGWSKKWDLQYLFYIVCVVECSCQSLNICLTTKYWNSHKHVYSYCPLKQSLYLASRLSTLQCCDIACLLIYLCQNCQEPQASLTSLVQRCY